MREPVVTHVQRSVVTVQDVGDRVSHVAFQGPATWTLVTEGGLRFPVSKKADPSSKKWAKQDLANIAVQNDWGGFEAAWKAMESDLMDGGFSQ